MLKKASIVPAVYEKNPLSGQNKHPSLLLNISIKKKIRKTITNIILLKPFSFALLYCNLN